MGHLMGLESLHQVVEQAQYKHEDEGCEADQDGHRQRAGAHGTPPGPSVCLLLSGRTSIAKELP